MSRTNTKNLKKPDFYRIRRNIRAAQAVGNYNTLAVASASNVSAGTIRRVMSARTWNGFLALKAAQQRSSKTSAVERELATNIHGLEKRVARKERPSFQLNFPPTIDDILAGELEKLKALPTRDELDQELQGMQRRIDILVAMWRALSRNRTFNMLYGRIVRDAIAKLDESGDK